MLARCAMVLIGVLVAAFLTGLPADRASAVFYPVSVTGRVVNANGDPVEGMPVRHIVVTPTAKRIMDGYGVLTDADGRYELRLPWLEPRAVTLQFGTDTYEPFALRGYATEFLGNTALISQAEQIVAGGDVHVAVADFVLSPAGSISGDFRTPVIGRILYSSWAKAWAWNSEVSRWEVVAEQRMENGISRDYFGGRNFFNGYSLRGLPPGSYRVCAGAFLFPTPDHPPQCFGGAPTPGLSTPVVVNGTAVRDIDFTLDAGAQIEAVVAPVGGGVVPGSGGVIPTATMTTYGKHPETGEWEPVAGRLTYRGDHEVLVQQGLPTGEYRVRFSGPGLRSEWYPNAASLEDADEVAVTIGGTVPRLEARLSSATASGQTSTALTLSSSSTRPGISSPPTATAVVSMADGHEKPEGTVELLVGDRVFGRASLPNTGNTVTATLPADLTVGRHQVRARFIADATEEFFVSSQSPTKPVEVLPPLEFTAIPKPTVSGATKVGSTLTATAGTWKPEPSKLTYQWLRSGVAISGATARTYVLAAADAGTAITVRVTASKPGYATRYRTSTPTPLVTGKSLTVGTPAITGTARVGRTLTAASGSWGPAPVSLSYRWKRNGVAITGATGTTYLLTKADAGSAIAVTVTGKKTGYTTVSRASAARTVAAGG